MEDNHSNKYVKILLIVAVIDMRSSFGYQIRISEKDSGRFYKVELN